MIRVDHKKRFSFPLHIHISTLFVVLILCMSLTQIWLTNRSMESVLLEANKKIFSRIASETHGTLKAQYDPALSAISAFRQGNLASASSFNQRIEYVYEIGSLLLEYPHITSYTVSYPNGDFFVVSHLSTPQYKEDMKAPAHARFVAASSSVYSNRFVMAFYDTDFHELYRTTEPSDNFDPRTRDWFKQSVVEEARISDPYFFYRLQKVGLTIHRKAANGTVFAADVLLQNLSDSLRETLVEKSSVRVLFDDHQQVYAFSDPSYFDVQNRSLNNRRIYLSDLNSPMITSAVQQQSKTNALGEFEYNGEQWFGALADVEFYPGKTLHLLMAAKSDELLHQAQVIRRNTVYLSVALILIVIPLAYLISQMIAKPIRQETNRARAIERLDFSTENGIYSRVREIYQLRSSLQSMQATLQRFVMLTSRIAHEADTDKLLHMVCDEVSDAIEAKGVFLYLLDSEHHLLKPRHVWWEEADPLELSAFEKKNMPTQRASHFVRDVFIAKQRTVLDGNKVRGMPSSVLKSGEQGDYVFYPLLDRQRQVIGTFGVLYKGEQRQQYLERYTHYIEMLISYLSVTLDTRKLLKDQKALLDSTIKLMASAMDTKSPYTGNHCQRVPVLTEWLSKAAHDSDREPFKAFSMSPNQFEELHIAAWLHDCGKITTPEHVVDKATKLETIYNRIHEIRTRFEVLKRDVELEVCRRFLPPVLPDEAMQEMEQRMGELDEEFAFIADLNQGEQFVMDEDVERLKRIGQRKWLRTMDKSLGLSWEESDRLAQSTVKTPDFEHLLEDKPEHLIAWKGDRTRDARFNLQPTQYQANQGELYNLSVKRGTLNEEERFIINDHIVQTIVMLESLPFPSHMRRIPQIAGGHHEKMNGQGYPLGLKASEMPLTARAMAIADIFEALTSTDRPYKKAKTLSESLQIMTRMVADEHIDPDLFRLFIESGVYMQYARAFLKPEQIDDVDEAQYLSY